MYRIFFVFVVFVTLLLLGGAVAVAQNPGKTVTAAASKNKRLLVKSSLGRVTGIAAINAEEARQLITLALKITDDKNVEYVISSYQFSYRRIGVTEDEASGKTSAESDIVAQRFTATPLPGVWQKNIIDGLHQGEELYFFDIIVFDKQGRRFFAPELKITIQ